MTYAIMWQLIAKPNVRGWYAENGEVEIELHIAVIHGLNISAAGQSIISEVKYNVEKFTGLQVAAVNIFIESIKSE